jgi:hypothetical protein
LYCFRHFVGCKAVHCAGVVERKRKPLPTSSVTVRLGLAQKHASGLLFLVAQDIQIINLGVIWGFFKATGLP